MISSIKAAIQEIEHVVWPTVAETRKIFHNRYDNDCRIRSRTSRFWNYGSKGMFAIRSVTPHDASYQLENIRLKIF